MSVAVSQTGPRFFLVSWLTSVFKRLVVLVQTSFDCDAMPFVGSGVVRGDRSPALPASRHGRLSNGDRQTEGV
ncbi:hypothetical protein BC830DRAFT_1116626 [Chytriomyces sp. MP71]|nr:hypothetical protein BC830DRAFT_1116626 [Chytriomyces sp. MP71]